MVRRYVTHIHLHRGRARDAGWNEEDHPRDPHGQFAVTPGQHDPAKVHKFIKTKPDTQLHDKSVKAREAAGQTPLTEEEFHALRGYLTDFYGRVNHGLRTGGFEKWKEGKKSIQPFNGKQATTQNLFHGVAAIESALQKMPVYKGMTTRQIELEGADLDAFLQKWQPGSVVTEHAFTSTTAGDQQQPIAGLSGITPNVKMVLMSKSGRQVSEKFLTAHPEEREVMFTRNTRFKVNAVKKIKDATPGSGWVRSMPAQYVIEAEEV